MSISPLAALLLAGAPATSDLPPPAPAPAVAEAAPAETAAIPAAEAAQVHAAGDAAAAVPPAGEPEAAVNEIIVEGEAGNPPGDPLARLNAQTYDVTQAVDKAFVEPVAKGYEDAVPKPIRSGLRNFLRNLKAPVIALNFLLQLKPGKAAETLGRFAINSTIGVAGLVDVAKKEPFDLPYRPNGFADTLGYYGVGPGPFFYLPLIGPTTLRDLIGNTADGLVLPTVIGTPFNRPEYFFSSQAVGALNDRIQFDDELERIRSEDDPYTAAREYYLKMRQAEIDALRGVRVDSGAFTAPPPPTEDAPAAAPGGIATGQPPAAPEPVPNF